MCGGVVVPTFSPCYQFNGSMSGIQMNCEIRGLECGDVKMLGTLIIGIQELIRLHNKYK